jgi:hypothetical protein
MKDPLFRTIAILGLIGGLMLGGVVWFMESGRNLEFPPDPGSPVLHGTVADLDTGQPLAGVVVAASFGTPIAPWITMDRARTNERGEFRVRITNHETNRLELRKEGYVTLITAVALGYPVRLRLLPASARPEDLAIAQVHLPADRALDRFRLDLERGRVVPDGTEFDVEVRAADSAVVVVAGPGRRLQLQQRTDWPMFPASLRIAPDSGYVNEARVEAHARPMLCFVRRDRGPRYGAFGLFPLVLFPPPMNREYRTFDVVFNRVGGRGLGASKPYFQ